MDNNKILILILNLVLSRNIWLVQASYFGLLALGHLDIFNLHCPSGQIPTLIKWYRKPPWFYAKTCTSSVSHLHPVGLGSAKADESLLRKNLLILVHLESKCFEDLLKTALI